MAVFYKEDLVDVNLNSGTIHRSFLQHSIGKADNAANWFGVRLFRDGEPVNIEGSSVSGYFKQEGRDPIAITSGNFINGNLAEVLLPQACYNYEGQFVLAIKLINTDDGVTSTMRIIDGIVDNTNTGGAVAPTDTVPTYQEILAVYDQMVAAKQGSVRFDITQELSDAQRLKAQENIGAYYQPQIDDITGEIGSTTLPTTAQTLTGAIAEHETDISGLESNKVPKTTKVNGHALSDDVTVTKSDVGLGNCDNTSDANKPISTATQTALDGKVPTTRKVNGHALSSDVTVTKGDVGLGNCDNTSDANKPISTAQAAVNTQISGLLGDTALPTTAQTVTGAIAEHEGDLGDLKSAINSMTNPVVLTDWESGSFNTSTGANVTANNYIRNQMLFGLSTGVLSVKCDSGYLFLPRAWNASGTYLGTLQTNNTFSTSGTSYQMCTSFDCGMFPDYKFKIAMRMEPSSTSITTVDGSHCTFNCATDKTLTQENKAADAKAVGDLKNTLFLCMNDAESIITTDITAQITSEGVLKSVNSSNPSMVAVVPISRGLYTINITNRDISCRAGYSNELFNGQDLTLDESFLVEVADKIVCDGEYQYLYVYYKSSSYTQATISVTAQTTTDEKLTKKGIAADSKTVGDKLKTIIPISLPYTIQGGAYIKASTGETESSAYFDSTGYISVEDIDQIIYSRIIVSAGYRPSHGIAFYDNNKDYIADSGIVSIAQGSGIGYETYTADVPDGAKYVRCTMWDEAYLDSISKELPEFVIIDKKEYDKTLESKIDNIDGEVTSMAILHAVPQSEGVQNAILKARQFTDILWTPVADMPGIIYSNSEYVYKTHKKGCRQKGIPYGSGLDYDQMVGDSISFDAFATAVKSSGSVLYTQNEFVEDGKKACYYGVACSKLVQACWGAPELVNSQAMDDLPGIVKIANPGEYTFDDIQLCDGIINPNVHCTIVTDIIRSAVSLEVVAIEISEAVTPTCRRLIWSKGEFNKHFGNYSLYRYSYLDNAKYNKARYIDLDDGYEGVNDIPFAIRRGSFINMKSTSSYKADIDNTKWTTLHDIVNGVEQTSIISSSEVTIPKDRTGYHEVYPTDANGNRGNSSFYYVYTLSVSGSVSGDYVTVTYSITDGAKPYAIVFDATHYSFVTTDTGTITAEIPTGKTSCYVLFRSDYGTIKSSSISLT